MPFTDTKLMQRTRRRLGQMRHERETFIRHWRDLSDFIAPRRSRFLIEENRNRGTKRHGNIIDNVATMAARTFRNQLMSGLTSPVREWFKVQMEDVKLMEEPGVKEWLFSTETRLREIMARSNLYKVLPRAYYDLGIFGTACMALVEDPLTVIRAESIPIGQFFLATNDKGEVVAAYREFQRTTQQLFDQFGKDNLSDQVKHSLERGKTEQWWSVVHAIERNDSRVVGSPFVSGMPWRSMWYEANINEDPGKFLHIGGFREFPVVAPRWDTSGEDIYGTECPGMEALGDIRALQLMQRRKQNAIDHLVRPPLVADANLRNERVSLLPGDVTYLQAAENTPGLKPVFQVDPRLGELLDDIRDHRDRIRTAFFEDLFRMLAITAQGSPQMTAREVDERHEEKIMNLGPVLERLNDELLEPIIDITFAYAAQQGLIEEPPEAIAGANMRIKFISILHQSQLLQSSARLRQMFDATGEAMRLDPNAGDVMDTDEALRQIAEGLGIDPILLRSKVNLEALRQQRAAQAAQQQAAAAAAPMAKAAKDLSEADLSGDSALSRFAGAA